MIDLEQVFAKKRRGNNVTVYNTDEIDFKPFAFVLNVKELVKTHSVAIAPGYILRKAHETEIKFIKEFLTENGTRYGTAIWEDKPVVSGKVRKLPKKLWRYFVIEFEDDEPNLDLLESALAVAPSGLDVGVRQDQDKRRRCDEASMPASRPKPLSIAVCVVLGQYMARQVTAISWEFRRQRDQRRLLSNG
jgi:hypothetical protein